jgi:hypothetical protein
MLATHRASASTCTVYCRFDSPADHLRDQRISRTPAFCDANPRRQVLRFAMPKTLTMQPETSNLVR